MRVSNNVSGDEAHVQRAGEHFCFVAKQYASNWPSYYEEGQRDRGTKKGRTEKKKLKKETQKRKDKKETEVPIILCTANTTSTEQTST